jgi:hypothetical protein
MSRTSSHLSLHIAPTAMLLAALTALALPPRASGEEKTKTETFDEDPGWQGVNHRAAIEREPAAIRQDFGYSLSEKAGGRRGEIGGFVMPAGEAAYYARAIDPKTFADPLSASGAFSCPDGPYHVLLGFFNASSVNEWRTPNTIAIRLNGRGDHFFAYVEYCTSKWRAGGDTTPFPSREDPKTGRKDLIGFPSGGKVHRWTLRYDPAGNGGRGVVTATIGKETAVCQLDEGHQADGATFNRFGILNVVKSADGGGEVYFDDITVNGEAESFDVDPRWEGRNNRRSYRSTLVRPRYDLARRPTNFAGGKAPGELGGIVFRGDCRYPDRMACLGDALGPLSLEKPLRAAGKIAMRRGVSDSTALFGFYSSNDSMRRNDSQSDGVPESVLGIHIEGPSADGFYFYPVYRAKGGNGRAAPVRQCPRILPDGKSHDWSLEYDPGAAGGLGRITITLDGTSASFDLDAGAKAAGTRFDRFGVVSSWIDGNSQDVYWDDLTYTIAQ